MDTLPYTPRVKKALALAHNLAREHGLNYVGIEHVLMQILADIDGPAAKLLAAAGYDRMTMRSNLVKEFEFSLAKESNPPNPEIERISSLLLEVIEIIGKMKIKNPPPSQGGAL